MGLESVDPKSIKIDAKDTPPPTDISMPDRGQKPGEEQDLVDRGVKPGEEQGMDLTHAKIAAGKFPTLPDDDGSKLQSTPGVVSDSLPQMPIQKEGPSETKAATSDAKAFDAESATVKTGIDEARALLDDVKSGKVTDDKAVIDAFKTAKEANENAKQLEAKADTPEKKIAAGTLLEEAKKIVDEFKESVKDIEKKEQAEDERKAAENMEEGPKDDTTSPAATPPEATTPEPKKSNMEKIADGLGKAFEKLIEFFGKVSEAISNALDKAGVNKKNMLKLFGNVPLIGDVLRSKVQVDDIHAQIEKTFGGKDKILKTDKDSQASSDLKKAFDNEAKPAGSTESFDQFVQKRAEAVKAAGKTEQITIEDLVNIKPIETKPADAKPADATKPDEKGPDLTAGPGTPEEQRKLFDAGAYKNITQNKWEVLIDLGGETGKDKAVVEFRKSADGSRWEWMNNSADAQKIAAGGNWMGHERFDLKLPGLTSEQKANREKMNKLADDLGVKDKPAETPEEKNKRYIVALAEAMNETAGGDNIATFDGANDDWRIIASKLARTLHDEKFQEALALETENGGTLEATDTNETTSLIRNAVTGGEDRNLLENWENTILTNPEKAVQDFLAIDPLKNYTALGGNIETGAALSPKSRDAVTQIQQRLKNKLKI